MPDQLLGLGGQVGESYYFITHQNNLQVEVGDGGISFIVMSQMSGAWEIGHSTCGTTLLITVTCISQFLLI